MKMISKIMRSMRDTGLLDGMSDEDVDTIATAALEGMREPTQEMCEAAVWLAADDNLRAMIDAALNE